MIDDPIVISTDFIINHFKVSSDPIFGYQDETFIVLTLAVSVAAWFIYVSKHSNSSNYNIGGMPSATREEFMDYMAENYPEYLEWLLFHPEWF